MTTRFASDTMRLRLKRAMRLSLMRLGLPSSVVSTAATKGVFPGLPRPGLPPEPILAVLRFAVDDEGALVKGIAWLKANQRESGRWFTRSLNNDKPFTDTFPYAASPNSGNP